MFFCLQAVLSRILAGHLELSGLSWMKWFIILPVLQTQICVYIKINIYLLRGFALNIMSRWLCTFRTHDCCFIN